MSLEPVAKCRPEHACGGARRPAFHDEVLAVEEICGISAIEGKRLESGVRGELRGGPFPSIAQHSLDTEIARPLGESIDGRGIPLMKIKVPELGGNSIPTGRGRGRPRRQPPGRRRYGKLFPLLTGSVRSAVPLRFRGEGLPFPPCVSGGFGMAHINGPVQRKGDVTEHCSIKPFAVRTLPEHRV